MTEDQQHRLALPQGTRIRDFEFHRVLGHGGFGMTYLGWNLALDIPVAIKEYLPGDLAIRERDLSVVPQSSQAVADFQWGLERFLDEARTLARFQHPNIVRVHHFFEAHSTAYIAMDYVEGETLSAHIERKGTLHEAEIKGILYPLLSALEVVHGADFLHRDIKPGNIVLRDSDGSPVLLDFGAARQAVGAKSRSVTSIVTPGYAPIEQYSSRGRQGPWTDIYALGGVCYRALTGDVPEDATDRVRDDPLVPVAQRCADRASGAFLSAVDWALSVDEGDRPQRVGAWREAMEGAAAKGEKDADDATSVGRVEQDAPQERPHDPDPVLNDDEPQRQKQAFVAEVGRQPHPRGKHGGATDLHIAARLNLSMLTQSLLTQGADVHAQDNEGDTPLHMAAGMDAAETAKLLLESGANVNAKTNRSQTPLHEAAMADAVATAKVLLEHGADINAKTNKSRTPLHWAARADASATAKVLLENGANAYAQDNEGDTPLAFAEDEDASATEEVLRRYGDRVNKRKEGRFKVLVIMLTLMIFLLLLSGLLSL